LAYFWYFQASPAGIEDLESHHFGVCPQNSGLPLSTNMVIYHLFFSRVTHWIVLKLLELRNMLRDLIVDTFSFPDQKKQGKPSQLPMQNFLIEVQFLEFH